MKSIIGFCVASIVFLGLISSGHAQNIDDLVLMSEEFPPYNFSRDGKLQGTSIDLMVLCLEKLHSKLGRKDIKILPWARSYHSLLTEKNTVLFAMTRTPQREHLFKWVGPISDSLNVLIAKKTSNIRIRDSKNIVQYKIGVVRDDAGEQLVVEKLGIAKDHLDIASEARFNILKLDAGRIDLFAYDENVAKWVIKQEGLNPSDFETVKVIGKGYHYFGFNRDTPDAVIRQFQNALDEIKKEGRYLKIINKYTK